MKLIVGIDFGTSTTVVRYRLENSDEIKPVKDADGRSDAIPTVIFRSPGGDTEYGKQALASSMYYPEGLITNFKMDLLDPSKREQAMELIEEFFRYIYGLFRLQTKDISYTSMDVNINCPAIWDDKLSEEMKEAVRVAGFKGKIRTVKEPEAVMRNMVRENLKELQKEKLLGASQSLKIMLLDMGEGTTDISIFKLSMAGNGIPRISELVTYSSRTENILCGVNGIDEALQKYLLDYLKKKGVDATDYVELPVVKDWKEQTVFLNLKLMQPCMLPSMVKQLLRFNHIDSSDFSLDRASFEQATKKQLENLYQFIVSAMAKYPYAKPEDIDFVCLTGGHSAWYTVPNLFNGEGVCNCIAIEGIDPDFIHFRKLEEESWRWNVMANLLPHECVARGLCLIDERTDVPTPSDNDKNQIYIVEKSDELRTEYINEKLDINKKAKDMMIVGIDFGTSTTVVRYRLDNSDKIEVVTDADRRSAIIPTVIFRDRNGNTEYGMQALASAMYYPEGLITNFKMDLLDSNKREQTAELITEFFRYIYGLFQTQTRGQYTNLDVNISYPAKWDDEMAKVMIEAAAAAGFKGNIRGVKEPEAAMRNMVWTHLEELQEAGLLGVNHSLRMFLLDMGAGTSDISIFKLAIDEEGIPHMTEPFSYPSRTENILCGGREIDEALQKYLLDYLKEKGLDDATDCVELSAVKDWKEHTVSRSLKFDQPCNLLSTVYQMLRYNHIDSSDFSLDRADFEQATKKHWRNLYQLIVSAMTQYPYANSEDIDFVCLTGGHSAWYTVPKLFNGEGVCGSIAREGRDPDFMHFSKLEADPWRWNVMTDGLPHECVAQGLCLMDKRMVVDLSSSNNVWAKITIDGQEGELTQVVDKLEILPVSKEVSLDAKIGRNFVWGNLKIDAQVDIYTGETQENAEHRVYKMKEGEDSVLYRILMLLFSLGVGMFVKFDINSKVILKVTMTEKGSLEIDGEFKVLSKSVKFTYDDLEIVKAE